MGNFRVELEYMEVEKKMCFYSLKLNAYQIHQVHLIHLMSPSFFPIAAKGVFWARICCKMAKEMYGEEREDVWIISNGNGRSEMHERSGEEKGGVGESCC